MEPAPWTPIAIPDAPVIYDLNSDIAKYFWLDMALAHNVIIRGIIALWTHAPAIVPADEKAFAGYALACLKFIHVHHDSEETILFPRFLEKQGSDVKQNIEQHESFQNDMDVFEEYITKVYEGEEKYDGGKTRQLLTAFADPLVQHLKDELTTATPEKLSVFTKDELTALSKELEDHIKSEGTFFTFMPYALTSHSKEDAPQWPPIPGPVKWLALSVGYWVNRSFWKFAPYTRAGEPQQYTP